MSTKLLTSLEAAERLRTTRGYLAKLRCSGEGPRFVKISSKVLYREADLESFINNRVCHNTVYHQNPEVSASSENGGSL